MVRTISAVAVLSLIVAVPAAQAASGTIEYFCTSTAAQQSLDAASVQGHSALFYYRLRRAVEAGDCKVTSPPAAAQASPPPASPPRVQVYNPPKPRVRTAERNGFPPSWLFRPLR